MNSIICEIKQCSKCRKVYEGALKDHFHSRQCVPSGLNGICKMCLLSKRHKFEHKNEKGSLLCVKCHNYKDSTEFDENKEKWYRSYKDSRCKSCKAQQREFRRISSRGSNGLERLMTERYAGLRDRAKAKNLKLDFNKDYLKELWNIQNGKCAISGLEMTAILFNGRTPTNFSVDRIDSSKGYVKGNIQLVSMAVNQMKSDLSTETLLYFCKKIIENNESKS